MNLLKFYQTYKLYIFPIVVVLSSLILIIFILYPQTISLLENQKEKTKMTDRSKFLDIKVQALEGYDLDQLNRKVNSALNAYPSDKDFVVGMGLLQDLISQSGYNVISIRQGSGSLKSSNVQSYGLNLEIIGPQALLPILINKIESLPRLMRVDSLEIASGRDAQATTISLNINALYSNAPADFGTIDSTLPELTQKDEEVLVRLAKTGSSFVESAGQPGGLGQFDIPASQLGPRGKENPFE